MKNEEAIQILKPLREMMIDQNGCPISDAVYALDVAIEALEAQKMGEWKEYKPSWLKNDGQPAFMICSKCNHIVINNDSAHWNFCPNCGADMRGEEK